MEAMDKRFDLYVEAEVKFGQPLLEGLTGWANAAAAGGGYAPAAFDAAGLAARLKGAGSQEGRLAAIFAAIDAADAAALLRDEVERGPGGSWPNLPAGIDWRFLLGPTGRPVGVELSFGCGRSKPWVAIPMNGRKGEVQVGCTIAGLMTGVLRPERMVEEVQAQWAWRLEPMGLRVEEVVVRAAWPVGQACGRGEDPADPAQWAARDAAYAAWAVNDEAVETAMSELAELPAWQDDSGVWHAAVIEWLGPEWAVEEAAPTE